MSKYIVEYKYRASTLQRGGWAMLINDEGHWTAGELVSNTYIYEDLLKEAVVFKSVADAHKFMSTFEGHPWYNSRRVNGLYRVKELIKVKKEIYVLDTASI